MNQKLRRRSRFSRGEGVSSVNQAVARGAASRKMLSGHTAYMYIAQHVLGTHVFMGDAM